MMTKNLFTSSFIALTLMFSVTQGHANAPNQTSLTTQQYNKNLVNEWVKYKFISAELEQQGAAYQANIMQQLGKKTKTGNASNIDSQLKKLAADAKQKFESIHPQTTEVKKLLNLQTENMEMMLKVMPNHFQLMADGENSKIDTDEHLQQFMKFSQTTAAANEHEKEVESLVMQYLKNNPLN